MTTQGPLAPGQAKWAWVKASLWIPGLSAGPWGSAYLSEDFMLATGLGQPQDPPEPQTQLITIKKLPITPSLQPVLCL